MTYNETSEDQVPVIQYGGEEPVHPNRKLYDKLHAGGLYSKTYDDFRNQFSTPDAINKLHGKLKEKGLYTKDDSSFGSQFFPTITALNKPSPAKEAVKIFQLPDQRPAMDQQFNRPVIQQMNTRQGSITEHETVADKIQREANEGAEKIHEELKNINPTIKKIVEKDKLQKSLSEFQQPGNKTDATQNTQLQQKLQYLLPKTVNAASEEEVNRFNAEMQTNHELARYALHEHGKLNPDKKKDIDSAIYAMDATNRGKSTLQVSKNIEDIKNGKVEYNIKNGSLTKKQNAIESIASGRQQTEKELADYDRFSEMSNVQLADELEKEANQGIDDLDKPQPESKGLFKAIGSEIVGMGKGAVPAVVAGGIASAIPYVQTLSPEIGAAVGSVFMSPEIHARAWKNALSMHFQKNMESGMNKYDATVKAREQADFDSKVDTAAMMAMNFVGFKSGFKPASLTSPFKTVMKNELKSFFKEAVPTAGKIGAISAAGTAVKNIEAGENPLDNTVDNAIANIGMVLPITAAATLGRILVSKSSYRPMLNQLSKLSKEELNHGIGEAIVGGHIKPEDVPVIHEEITKQQKADAKVPESVHDDEIRLQIQEHNEKLEHYKDQKSKAGDDEAKKEYYSKKIDETNTKIAELTKEGSKKTPVSEGKEMILEDIADNEADWVRNPGYVDQAQKDPEGFLKAIADQAQDEYNLNGEMISSRPLTEEHFGKHLVAKAVEAYPKLSEKPRHTVSTPVIKNVKLKENAIPEQIAGTVGVHDEPAVGKTMGEGNTQPEIPTGEKSKDTGESKIEEVSEPPAGEKEKPLGSTETWDHTNITHAEMNETAKELGLPEYEGKAETIPEWNKQADEDLAKGGIDRVINKLNGNMELKPHEVIMASKYAAAMKAKTGKELTRELIDEFAAFKKATDNRMSQWGKAGRASQEKFAVDDSAIDMIVRKEEAKKKKLSKEEVEEVNAKSEKIKKTKGDIKQKGKDMADAIRKLKINKGDNLQSNLFSIPVAIYDGAITTIANAVEQGYNLADAIAIGIKHVKDNGGFKDKIEERAFEKHIKNGSRKPLTEEQRLNRVKLGLMDAIHEMRTGTKTKNKSTPVELDKEALDLRVQLDDARHEFEESLFKDKFNNATAWQKFLRGGQLTIGTTKAAAAGVDDSAVGVQNYFALLANPHLAPGVLKEHVLDTFSDARFKRNLAKLHNDVHYPLMQESGLEVIEPQSMSAKKKEEVMSNSLHDKALRFSKNVPDFLKGKNLNPLQVLSPFERAFASLGNNLRVRMFMERATPLLEKGYTFKSHPEEFTAIARIANEATGRGKLHSAIEKNNDLITAVVWSPKLLASSLNMLGINDLARIALGKEGGYYRTLPPRQRLYAIRQAGTGIAAGVTAMGAAAYMKAQGADVDVDYDPFSVTFGNIRMGNKTLNVFGRFSPVVKVLAQAGRGIRRTPGGEQDLDNPKFGGKNRGAIVGQFFRGKMTPAAGTLYDYVFNAQKDSFTQKPLSATDALQKMVIPINFQAEILKNMERDGSLYLLNDFLPNFMGLNVKDQRDFERTPSKRKKKKRID